MSFWSRAKDIYRGLTMTQKLIAINTGLFFCWRFKGIPETFMAKHFSCSRYNVQQGRLHTLVTHAFSNQRFFSWLFDVITIYFFGTSIERRYGGNRLLKLYLLGALLGGIVMTTSQPKSPFLFPQTGATTAVTALLTYQTCFNLGQRVLFFVFPMRIEFLIGIIFIQAIFDPLHRNFGGIFAGTLGWALMRRGLF